MIKLFFQVICEMMNTLPPIFAEQQFSEPWVRIAIALSLAFYTIVTICFTIHLIRKHAIH